MLRTHIACIHVRGREYNYKNSYNYNSFYTKFKKKPFQFVKIQVMELGSNILLFIMNVYNENKYLQISGQFKIIIIVFVLYSFEWFSE